MQNGHSKICIKRQHRRLNRHRRFALLFEDAPAPPVIADCATATGYENMMSSRDHTRCDAMTPEEALNNILKLFGGSDELEDAHALQIFLQSIKTLAEKGLGRSN